MRFSCSISTSFLFSSGFRTSILFFICSLSWAKKHFCTLLPLLQFSLSNLSLVYIRASVCVFVVCLNGLATFFAGRRLARSIARACANSFFFFYSRMGKKKGTTCKKKNVLQRTPRLGGSLLQERDKKTERERERKREKERETSLIFYCRLSSELKSLFSLDRVWIQRQETLFCQRHEQY